MAETTKLTLSNISCASCVETIESALKAVAGVDAVQVHFALSLAVSLFLLSFGQYHEKSLSRKIYKDGLLNLLDSLY